MSSPAESERTTKPAELFQDLWRQLGECHQNALQELEEKVIKLKKERCLDAQRLEVFYNRNLQSKEQIKTLQDTISVLEDRLRAGQCERCSVLEENLKSSQDQKERLIIKLKHERNSLEDENRKLHVELQKLKMCHSEAQRTSSSDQEDGVIPDSPVLPSTLPFVNKLKKRNNVGNSRHVRYVEIPLPQSNRSLFNEVNQEPVDVPDNLDRAEVLVPNTCEFDSSQISDDANVEEVIAETCGLELLRKPDTKTKTTAGQQGSTKPPWFDVRLKPYRSTPTHSPDSTTERSPSQPPLVKRLSEDASICKAKRKREGAEAEEQEEDKRRTLGCVEKGKRGRPVQSEPAKQAARLTSANEELADIEAKSELNRTPNPTLDADRGGPAFKKPTGTTKERANRSRNPPQDLKASRAQLDKEDGANHAGSSIPEERERRVEPTWSVDPALALSMYDTEWRADEEERHCHGEPADSDCTWISHSVLQRQEEKVGGASVSGVGEKANDSLDIMFDTTAYGEYKSFNGSHLGHSQPCGGGDEDEDDGDEEVKEEEEDAPLLSLFPKEQAAAENTPGHSETHKARHPTFAHVAVVRKKEERQKLKGTTCKECEIYYAHLPEEEKQKKLSACSRHRFLYIPPCTPENFWEVGFPSTQTCIERGYIKEEKTPQARSRRRQPLNALFSPKRPQKESQSRFSPLS